MSRVTRFAPTAPLATRRARLATPRRLTLCSALALAFAAPLSPAVGSTVIELTPDHPVILDTPTSSDLGAIWGDMDYQGMGRLVKTGAGDVMWGSRRATFALKAGSWIDVREGRFIGGSSANEDWSRNQASLQVAQGAVFDGVEANVRVDALTGSGSIRSGFFDGHSSYGYKTFTFGVANGSGSFAGVLADGNSAGHYTKVGTGTQVLTGSNSYTGGTHVAGGTLAIGDGGTSGAILGPVQVDAGATLAFNRSDDTSFAGLVRGEGRFIKQGGGTLSLSQGVRLSQGVEIQAGVLEMRAGSSLQGPLVNHGTLKVAEDAELVLRDGIAGRGRIEHHGLLLNLSGQVTADAISAVRYDWEGKPLSRLQIGDSSQRSDVNVRELYAGYNSQIDIVGPQTRVFWQSLGDSRKSELTLTGGLLVRDGAQLTINQANLRYDQSELRVQGPGSLVEITDPGRPFATHAMGGGRIVVEQGARLVTSSLFLEGQWGASSLLVQGQGTSMQVGHFRSTPGTQIQVLDGGLLEGGDAVLSQSGAKATHFGQFSISGTGSRWLHDGVLRGNSRLSLTDGGLLRAQRIEAFLGMVPTLRLHGGVLELTEAGQSFVSGLDWQHGRVILGSNTALNRDVLTQTLVLDAGRQLEVRGNLQINAGEHLSLWTGGQLQAHQLVLAGGSFSADVQADFRSVLDWQQGHLLLRGHAELNQGWLAGRNTLDAQRTLSVEGRLSSQAGAPTLTLQDTAALFIQGDLQLQSDLTLGQGATLHLERGTASHIKGQIRGSGTVALDRGAQLSLRGTAELASLGLMGGSELRLEGPGSTLQLRDSLSFGGSDAKSRIQVLDGARFSSAMPLVQFHGPQGAGAVDAPTLLVSGTGSRFEGQAIAFLGGRFLVDLGGALQAGALQLHDGTRLQAQHAGTQLDIGQLQVNAGAHLALASGALLNSRQALLAGAQAQLTGAGTQWLVSEGLTLQGGQLQLLDGARLHSDRLDLSAGAELLVQGGSLRLDRQAPSFIAGLNWSHGELTIGSDTGLNQGLLGADLRLADGRSLAVQGRLSVQQGHSLQLAQGGTLQAQQLVLAGGQLHATNQANFSGQLDWQSGRMTLVGDARQDQGLLAQLPVLDTQHTLRVEGGLTLAGGPLVLDGGVLDVDRLQALPTAQGLDWRSGQLTVRGDARLNDGLPQQLVMSAGKQLHVGGQLWVDRGSQLLLDGGVLSFAVLNLNGGRLDLSPQQALSGHFDWQEGTLAFKGDVGLGNPWLGGRTTLQQGRVLEVAGQLQLGTGQLRVEDGGVLVTHDLKGQGAGRLLLDGGTVRTRDFSADTAARLSWSRGTLAITGDAGAALGQGGFKRLTVLNDGQTLHVNRTLTLARGTQLLLDGGHITAGTLALQGGTLASTEAPLQLAGVNTLQGHGLVNGAVQGGARTQLIAQGGTLTLGDANVAGGFVHAGSLRVASGATALLLSADATQLGALTELEAGARLSTLNGALLTQGGVMHFQGDATVQGEFTHQGRIEGTGGTLSFLNDVQGAGSFAGSVLFKAGYQPGNSPASIDFGGGRLGFDSKAVLTLEFFGMQPGSGYDQLLNIGSLDFQGTLNLQFDSSFKPVAGSRFQLFDFKQFSGSLSADRITVTGLDRQQLDLSQLAGSGQLVVTAVPEPGTWALMGLGLLGLAWRQRRQRSQPQHSASTH